jgi:hypothetical protein
MLLTPGKYKLYVAAARGPVADELQGQTIAFRKGIVGFVTRTGAVVNVSDAGRDNRFDEEIDALTGFETHSVLCAPIQFEGNMIGALELLNSPREGGFTQGDSNILSYLGTSVAEYILTSLPSREADFSDREFLEPIPRPGAGKKKASATPTRKKASGTPAKKEAAPQAAAAKKPGKAGEKPAAAKKTPAAKPAEKKPAKGGSKKKSRGKGKKRKKKR